MELRSSRGHGFRSLATHAIHTEKKSLLQEEVVFRLNIYGWSESPRGVHNFAFGYV